MKLWLDDIREPPDCTWTWVKTVPEAVLVMTRGEITHASLDNDLGEDETEGRKLVLWMAEHDVWPIEEISIHSANPIAADYMRSMVERYGPFRRSPGAMGLVRDRDRGPND